MKTTNNKQQTTNNKQQTILNRFLVFVMSISLFILSSCEKELYEENLKSNNQNIELKHISISDVKKNKVVYDKLTKPSARFIASNSNKIITDSINNFSIDSDEGVYIQSEDYESYTFEVTRNNGSIYNLENVVVSKLPNNTYQTILIQYNLTDEELEAYRNGEYINFIGKTNKIVLEDSVVSDEIAGKYLLNGRCYEDVQQFVQGHNCTEGGNHTFGNPDCIGFGGPTGATISHYVTVSIEVPCDEGGGGGEPTPVPTTNPSSGFFGGTGGTRGQIITTPTTMTAAQIKTKKFKMQLSSGQNQCFNNLPPQVKAELENFVAYTLIPLEDGTTPTTNDEDPIHNEAEEMMEQMCDNQGIFNSITPFLIEKKIDDSELDDCTKGILNAIRNSQNNDIATIIAKLDNSPSTYNTKIVSTNVGSIYTTLAKTNWTGKFMIPTNTGTHTPFDYKIGIHSTMVNQGTTVQIYATLLHELIHAYFLSLIDDCIADSNSCQPLMDLPFLWNHYVNYKNGTASTVTSPISQHNQLATSYVDIIIAALQEFQPGLPQQVYSDLAWGGLQGTIPYENNDPLTRKLTDEDRHRHESVNLAEALNQPQVEYDNSGNIISTHYPQGTPCQ